MHVPFLQHIYYYHQQLTDSFYSFSFSRADASTSPEYSLSKGTPKRQKAITVKLKPKKDILKHFYRNPQNTTQKAAASFGSTICHLFCTKLLHPPFSSKLVTSYSSCSVLYDLQWSCEEERWLCVPWCSLINWGQESRGNETTKDAGFCSHPLSIVDKLYVLEPICAFTRSCIVSQTWRWHLLFK